jgi:hypothetical protein
MKAFEKTRLRRHDFHGDWNYTVCLLPRLAINPSKINTLIQGDP